MTHDTWTRSDDRAFLALRETAITRIAARLRPSLAPVWEAFGADPEEAARADAGYHLEALHTALSYQQPQALDDYLGWLQEVLVSRGADAELLADSLSELETFFAEHLPEPTRGSVTALLAASRQSLSGRQDAVPDYGGEGPEAWEDCPDFQKALLAGDHARSNALFEEAVANSGDQVMTAVHMVQPALYAIGRKWQRNSVTVTQEHLATAIVEAVLAQASGLSRPASDSGRSVVLARAPGNHHALGMRVIADAFEMAGWQVQLFQDAAAADTLLPALREMRPQLMGLSAALPPHLLASRELLRQLRGALGEGMPRVILGGLAVNQYPEIARAMGAEIIGPDAESLVQALAQMDSAA